MIEVNIEGDFLTQWDKGRYITIHCCQERLNIVECRISSNYERESLIVDVEKESDCKYRCKIPDILLEKSGFINVWAVSEDETTSKTITQCEQFSVNYQPKPEGYIASDERETLDSLIDRKVTNTIDEMTNYQVVDVLAEIGLVSPIISADGLIYTDSNDKVIVV